MTAPIQAEEALRFYNGSITDAAGNAGQVGSVAKGMPGVIGREPELAMLEEFLAEGTAWLALLLTGGPGIGKTALWERGLDLAADRGIRVLSARPSGAEAELSFAGLFDLLEGIDIGSMSGLQPPPTPVGRPATHF